MNVQLVYNTKFIAINAVENKIYPNVYKCKINLLTVSDDSNIQNIAFERIKFFISQIVDGSVFIQAANPVLKTFLESDPLKVIIVPEPPFDQVIGMTLYKKLNAITENHLAIYEVEISSKVGRDIGYLIDEGDDFGEFEKEAKITPWWNRADFQTLDSKPTIQQLTWKDLGLDWEDDEFLIIEEDTLKINKKSKKKKVEIINVFEHIDKSKFLPTVVSGGLDTNEPQK